MQTEVVIQHFKNRATLAKVLSVAPSAVSVWVAKGVIPEKHALRLEKITNGALLYDESFYRTISKTNKDVD